MAIIISDDILQAQNLDEQTLRIEVAAILYDKEVLSLGMAAQMAGLDRMQFQAALSDRGVDVKIDIEDLQQDLATLKKLGLYDSH